MDSLKNSPLPFSTNFVDRIDVTIPDLPNLSDESFLYRSYGKNLDLKTLTLDGRKVSYVEGGRINRTEDAPSLFFVHGNSLSARIFEEQLVEFSKTHHVLAINLPGAEDSERLEKEDYELLQQTDLCLKFLEKLGVESFIGIGFSSGASVLLQGTPYFGERLKGLVNIDQPLLLKPFTMEGVKPNDRLGLFFQEELTEEEVEEIAALCFSKEFEDKGATLSAMKGCDGAGRSALFNSIGSGKYNDERELLKTHQNTPYLLVTGEDSQITDFETMKSWAALSDKGSFLALPGGHASHVEYPELFNEGLRRFLDLLQ